MNLTWRNGLIIIGVMALFFRGAQIHGWYLAEDAYHAAKALRSSPDLRKANQLLDDLSLMDCTLITKERFRAYKSALKQLHQLSITAEQGRHYELMLPQSRQDRVDNLRDWRDYANTSIQLMMPTYLHLVPHIGEVYCLAPPQHSFSQA